MAGGAERTNTRRLIINCLLWYLTSSLSGVLTKQLLIGFPHVFLVTYLAFFLNVCYGIGFGAILPWAKVDFPPSREAVWALLPFSVARICTHLTSTTSIARIPLSLMHTIKSMGPLFTVLLAFFVLGQRTSASVVLALVPICVGVVLACLSEFEFDAWGALNALVSVGILALQSLFAKKLLNTRSINEFALMCHSSLICVVLCSPVLVLWEGPQLQWTSADPATGASILGFMVLTGLSQYLQGVFAYTIVSLSSPITQSIASVMKRVFVVVFSLLWFRTLPTPVNALGITLTFVGMFAYNLLVSAKQPRRHSISDLAKEAVALEAPADRHSPRGQPPSHTTIDV